MSLGPTALGTGPASLEARPRRQRLIGRGVSCVHMCDQLLAPKGRISPRSSVIGGKVARQGANLHCACQCRPLLRYKALATVPRMLATSYLFGQSPRSMIFLAAVCCNSGE